MSAEHPCSADERVPRSHMFRKSRRTAWHRRGGLRVGRIGSMFTQCPTKVSWPYPPAPRPENGDHDFVLAAEALHEHVECPEQGGEQRSALRSRHAFQRLAQGRRYLESRHTMGIPEFVKRPRSASWVATAVTPASAIMKSSR